MCVSLDEEFSVMLVSDLLLDSLARHGCVLVVGREDNSVLALPCGEFAVVVFYDSGDDTIQVSRDGVGGEDVHVHCAMGPGEACVPVAVSVARALAGSKWASQGEVAANPRLAAVAEFVAEESMAEV